MRVRLFVNDNTQSLKACETIKLKLTANGFTISEEDCDIAIAVGGDGSFLRMVKDCNFNSNILYVGVNLGTLGFLQEVKFDEIDEFIDELKEKYYKIEEVGIQETTVEHKDGFSRFYSLNEIIVRRADLKTIKMDISIDGHPLEKYLGDGILIASSVGSTAHNLSYGGSIVFNTFSSLQITPIAPINSKVYRTLLNSVIIPDKKEIELRLNHNQNELIVTIDGENNIYSGVKNIKTKIEQKKIQCIRMQHYNFPQKISEKLLTD